MKKSIFVTILLALFFISSTDVSAQHVAQFTQNMFNKLANNPGVAGSSGQINVRALHRQQWNGFEGAPVTQNISIDSRIPSVGGIGLNIVTDQIAAYSNLDLQLSYAYQAKIGTGELGIGLSGGLSQSGLDGTLLNPADAADPNVPGEISGSAFDFGAGLYYHTRDVYIGLSSLHIGQPVIEKDDGKVIQLSRHYFLLAGYYFDVNPLLSVNPSIYLKSDVSTSQLDINANFIYNKIIWSGVGYRLDDGIQVLVGMNITKDLKFGVAYDVTLSEIQKNGFEFMLGYNFNVDYDKPIKSYKNPRYL